MNFWWVNQGGSYNVEHANSFMWSPKKEINGRRNQAYENMKEIAPGDLIFSHYNSHVSSIGTAQSYCYECPRPSEFPKDQNDGNLMGWKVDVLYHHDVKKVHPKTIWTELAPLQPKRYSPLDINGQAAMKLYLSSISSDFAHKLMEHMQITENNFPNFLSENNSEEKIIFAKEETLVEQIKANHDLTDTEKLAIGTARCGQGLFRTRVLEFEKSCRVTGIKNTKFLIASHIKPWRESSNYERLDGSNGLMLSPNIDKLFDNYFISFSEDGHLLISPLLTAEERNQFHVTKSVFVGSFTSEQKEYLAHHRERLKSSKLK